MQNEDQDNHDGDVNGDACDDDDDNDGVLDGDDCAPINPFASLAASPPENLGWAESGDTTMTWTKGFRATYSNVYRSGIAPGSPAGFNCLQPSIFGTTHDDTDLPSANEGFAYVISSENVCGETDAGTDSQGQPRYPAPCP